jgi:Holliday junction resolvase RusA-like endonuclease
VPAPQHGDEGGRAGGRLARFTVPGPPVSKLRARSFIDSRTGGIGHFTPKKTVDFEHLVRTIARINYRGAPVQGQIALVVIQLYPTPASWSKSRRDRALSGSSLHTVKPDEDNVTKAVKDGLIQNRLLRRRPGLAYREPQAVQPRGTNNRSRL